MAHAGGRPSKYDKERTADLAYKFALLGATDEDMARSFDVDVATISNWKNDYPEFLEALKDGKERADANVSKSLYHRALGYEHPEVDIKVIDGKIVTTDLIKHYPPDTAAAFIWLKNRQKDKWRDQSNIDHTTKGDKIEPGATVDASAVDAFVNHIKHDTSSV